MDGASIDITFSEGEQFTIVCAVTASNPVVSTVMLSMRPDTSNVEFEAGTGSITITRATAANAGTYTCTADNGATTPTTISFILRMDAQSSATIHTVVTPIPTTESVGGFISFP